jgi:hypothetical protein
VRWMELAQDRVHRWALLLAVLGLRVLLPLLVAYYTDSAWVLHATGTV